MLFRSHLRSGISVIGLARSRDGLTGWRIDPDPFLQPARADDRSGPGLNAEELIAMEAGGVEDPRVSPIDGAFAITYSGYATKVRNRVRVALATTDDFTDVTRFGAMLDADMRNVVLFPERIGGRYIALFRPNDNLPGRHRRRVPRDSYRVHNGLSYRPVVGRLRTGHATHGSPSAFADKIGPGAPPVRTRHGWLNLFHGVRATMAGHPYVLGIALHDLANPERVEMSSIPVLFPSAADCRVAESDYVHVPNVVFSCAMLRRDDGSLLIYYGGNDTVMNVGVSHEDVLAALCQRFGQDPSTGRLRYAV
jgi:predicted GH43/DUF377 family glycosyl hydrolase